ncbi:TIGR04104 family putative zinc finger protein [Clostridium folliculivorans]|uniref:TIGR04104 family putative zinc finger protein n=1 Tax=Clostridium folliculivorans TaxID=2886038 RepID=UPI003CFED20C
MSTQKCKNCSGQFRWSDVIKSIGFGNKLECDNCKTRYYMNNSSRIVIFLLILIPLPFQVLLTSVFHSYSILIYLVWCVTILCVSPFLVKIHSKE